MDRAAGINDLEALDRAHYMHPSTHLKNQFAHGKAPSRIIADGEGVYVTDRKGREQPRRLRRPLLRQYRLRPAGGRRGDLRQAKKLAYYHTYAGHSTEAVIRLSDRLVGMAPAGMRRVFYGLSGSDANETRSSSSGTTTTCSAGREKKKIISRERGYHGARA